MTTVLVVEDQATVAAIVRYHLENAGWHGVFADDAESGWRMLVAENPDAAVIDLVLPGADGWTLVEKVRKDGRFHRLPIVILTGQQLDDEHQARANDLGCEYLNKPFAASALLTKVENLVTKADASPASPMRPATPGEPTHIDMIPVGVVLLVDRYQIEGKVYLPPELPRFSDAWESIMRDQRSFVPVTDATVTTQDGHKISSPPFIQVRKSELRAVYPTDLTGD